MILLLVELERPHRRLGRVPGAVGIMSFGSGYKVYAELNRYIPRDVCVLKAFCVLWYRVWSGILKLNLTIEGWFGTRSRRSVELSDFPFLGNPLTRSGPDLPVKA